jgi:hypothetical protein
LFEFSLDPEALCDPLLLCYVTQANPPASFVYVTLRNPVSGAEAQNVAALLDSAADQTVVPDALALNLGLNQLGTIPIAGVCGIVQQMPSYAAQLRIHNLPMHNLEVVGHPRQIHVLLGRDVLNSYPIVLDGPQLALEIG